MMAELTPKRVLPARERRESFKLQASSPPAPTLSPPKKTTPTQIQTPEGEPRVKRKYVRTAPLKRDRLAAERRNSTPLSEEGLPARVAPSKPLPTVQTKPEHHISTKEYQSIAESAILAASLHRSRLQWLCDGIFDRYWTKPIKRKGAQEIPPNNPDQKSMSKLGNCTITIEPHVFEATVYIVRDPQAPPPMPYARHPNQYPPKHQTPLVQQHAPFFTPPMVPTPTMNTPTNYHPTLPQAHPPPQKKIKQEKGAAPSSIGSTGTTPGPGRPAQSQSQPAATPPTVRKTSTTSTPTPKPNADPVIQMLASRAASDPRLKDLMKVVATSKATPTQLKEFQAHIDEFNAVIKRGEAEQREREERHSQAKTSPPTGPAQLDGSADQQPAPKLSTPTPTFTPSASHHTTHGSGNAPLQQVPIRLGHETPPNMPMHASPYPVYPPPHRPEPIVKHIVLELTSPASSTQPASQDRWLFPVYAVLDTPMSGRGLEMVCSFFVERKGSQVTSRHEALPSEDLAPNTVKWKSDVDYYQPVTMTLRAPQHKTLETIARAAKPLPQVQAYMADVMKNKTRAPGEYLALQLPVDKKGDGDVQMLDFTDSAVDLSPDEDDELKEVYGN